MLVVRVSEKLLPKWCADMPQIIYLLVEIDMDPRHCGWFCPKVDCAPELYDVRLGYVVVRWKNVDAKAYTKLIDGKVQFL